MGGVWLLSSEINQTSNTEETVLSFFLSISDLIFWCCLQYGFCEQIGTMKCIPMKSVFGHNFLMTSSPAYINNFQTVTDIVVILFRLSKDRFLLFKWKMNLRMVEVFHLKYKIFAYPSNRSLGKIYNYFKSRICK